MKRYRIGLIAPEFPPAIGGMEELAKRLARSLARTDEVVVYTARAHGLPGEPYEQRPMLTGHLDCDVKLIANETVDGWCALNAGLIALAPALSKPFAAYCHGNDFLDPWIVRSRFRMKPLIHLSGRRPDCRALSKVLERSDIARGLSAVSHLFANSTTTARLFRTHFPENRAPISVVPPAVQAGFFQAVTPSVGSLMRILTVARLEARKNVDAVLRALTWLPADLKWEYTVVGDGSMRRPLEQLARELRLADRVRFRGAVTEDALLACYRRADLFVLASRATTTDVEGFGMVYAEASAAGVPVICSREGGATDAVQDGVNGLVLPSSSPEDIAAGIIRFVHSRDQFCRCKVQTFAQRFEEHRVAAAFRTEFVSHL